MPWTFAGLITKGGTLAGQAFTPNGLSTYTFNTGTARHTFCRVCGVKSFYVPRSHPEGISVNARCLDPGSVRSMKVQPFEGRDWEKGRAEYRDSPT